MPSTQAQPRPNVRVMKELIRSNNPVTLSRVTALMEEEGIPVFELDTHMSVLDGSIGILPRRLMVADRDAFMARALLREAGIEP